MTEATFESPNPPYVGPAAHTSAGANKPVRRIVVHCTVSPCEPGGARNIGAYFRSAAANGSAHYVVDPRETVQCVYDGIIAWHAPPNQYSIGVELCDPMKGKAARWADENHHAMLRRAANLVAALCLAYDIPVRKLDAADLRAGRLGIVGHDDVSEAFRQSSHWDPGPAFPWPMFMTLVRGAVRRQSRDAVAPSTPGPAETVPLTRVQRARRLLRIASRRKEQTHSRRQSIIAALRELPPS
jgi:N-acetyl-anhydromuramyl-L-alanine amidase AmpD